MASLIMAALLASVATLAQDNPGSKPAPSAQDASSVPSPQILASGSPRDQLLGTDADSDGIRDDIGILMQGITTASEQEHASKVRDELDEVRRRSMMKPQGELSRSRCMEYLLMDPKHQASANLYVQGRTHGAFGTHPCDPIASPLLERPFDTDYARLDLGPMHIDYSHYE